MTTRMHRAGTRAVAVVVAGMMMVAAFAAIAPGASAATDSRFCTAVSNLQDRLDSLNGVNAKNFKDTYSQAGKAFKDAAKSAPKKVKKAMQRIGSFLSSVGSGDFTQAAQALGSKNGKAYSNAIVTYSTYVATNCP